jgi:hypothetical protein
MGIVDHLVVHVVPVDRFPRVRGRSREGPAANFASSRRQGVGRDGRRYNTHVITRGIREFADRDWGAARASKDIYWRDRIARLGPAEGLRIADELRRQAMRQNPGWPRPSDRRRDVLCHVRLAERLRRARSTRGR